MQLNRTRNDKRRMYFQEKKLLHSLAAVLQPRKWQAPTMNTKPILLQRQPWNLFYSTSLRCRSSLVLMPASYNAV